MLVVLLHGVNTWKLWDSSKAMSRLGQKKTPSMSIMWWMPQFHSQRVKANLMGAPDRGVSRYE